MRGFGLSNIDLRILNVFLDVVEHDGFSAVAEAKGVSLSAVTRDIAALETRLGLKLCRRGRGGFGITPDGDAVYRATRRFMEDVHSFEESLQSTRASVPHPLEIGIIDNFITNPQCPLIPVLRRFRHSAQPYKLRIGVHPVRSIDIMVRDRKLDLGFTNMRTPLPSLAYQSAFIEKHALFVSRHCPEFDTIVAWQPGVKSSPLPYVARSFPTDEFARFESSMPFHVTGFGDSLEGVLTAVAAGLGTGILPLHAAVPFDDLVALPYPAEGLSVDFHVVTRKDIPPKSAVAELARRIFAAGRDTSQFAQVKFASTGFV
jgi:DNA-binding transcriptional LysR family regulator